MEVQCDTFDSTFEEPIEAEKSTNSRGRIMKYCPLFNSVWFVSNDISMLAIYVTFLLVQIRNFIRGIKENVPPLIKSTKGKKCIKNLPYLKLCPIENVCNGNLQK